MEMGEKINLLRVQKGMTLEELGDKVGVGKSTVRKWENGMIANMRRDKIAKIADALDCSPAYLMGWEESVPDYIFTLPDGSKIIIEYMEPAKKKAAQRLLTYYFKLNEIGQKKALENIEDLSKIYSKDYLMPQAAHERTDIEVTDDMRKHDNDIMDDDAFWNK